ncbi:maltose O-acetyltransferase [Halosimplex carlsbadense 2-9-1]|uniref:Maltose O-acetyltransferase n=1 Tax=Halosimplex carlsbadense 2-9-1 TaxID=797114 RepID=M0CKA9_9EURY|nr:sugar O-acetyltransferase [Halosimplex carlsbadense]ELZ23676.1 maltose O-acetyltransferase [Halosimplex carlsbadense 2-9-1]
MDSEREKMLNGELYDASDPDLVAARQRARERTATFNTTEPGETDRRERLIRELFGAVEGTVHVEPPFRCDYGEQIRVGDGFYANFDCVVLDVCPVEFGENCLLGPGVHVYTATHPLDPEERASGLESGRPVSIGDHVWIGGQAVINPGVTVGDGAVIGSGAVVTDDVSPNVVVQGNPAEVVREIE